jgi:hypothetical protein
MHPPFGFALFYLRSVAPKKVKTSDIYWGAVPFVGIQVMMVALIIAFPSMISVANKTDMKEQIELNIDMGNELGADSAAESPSIDFSTDSGAGSDLKLQFSTEPMKK